MKAILSMIIFGVLCMAFVSCESDMPPNPDATNKLQRGITGQGALTQPDRSDDPLIRENTRVGY